MVILNKKYFLLRIFIFSFFIYTLCSCGSGKPGYNPYLRTRPLDKQYKSNRKALDKGTKNYSKQMRKNRKRIFGGKRPPPRPDGG